jgi:tRNA A-37 threonylcarbamoyl transferase component Bud32
MSEPNPVRPDAGDRNLLLGMLALQMDFVCQDMLVAAMRAWTIDRRRPLGEILAREGQLSPERLQLLEALVQEHLKAHQDDPHQSLAALPAGAALRQVMDSLGDAVAPTREARPVAVDRGENTLPFTPHGGPSAGYRYQVLRPHAHGGLGEVFVAEDTELHREVALKVIQEKHADDALSRERFLLEAEITGRLEHPGVVPVYGLGVGAEGRPFYAMRLLQGETLQGAIRRFHEAERPGRDPGERSLALRQLLGRFVAVANAVGYAHSRGVIHRDLKPSNIMLGRFGETVVLDWGLAKVVGRTESAAPDTEATLQPQSGDHEATRAGTTIGTAAFMSPEQAAGRIDQQGPASDVYSLGATLYAILTGRPPFGGGDVADTLRQVQAGACAPPRQVKPGTPLPLDAVCRKAMALRPEDRYASALELGAEVERWLADEPVQAWQEPWWLRWGRRARRRPVLALWLAVSAVAYGSVLTSTVVLPLVTTTENAAAYILGIMLFLYFLVGMSVAAQAVALVGAGVGLSLGLATAAPGARKPAGARGAMRGAGVGLVVGAALGYVGVWTFFLQLPVFAARGLRSPFAIATLLGPLLGAGLGLAVGARKAARIRGGVLGALAGAALALIGAGVLIGIETAEVGRDPSYRRRGDYAAVSRILIGLEKHAAAVSTAREYAQEFPDHPADAYNAACFIARCVPLAQQDPNLKPEEQQKTAEEYAGLAMQQLRAAVQAGYSNGRHMKADADLESLWGRQDFRDLLAELGAGP